MTVCCLNLTSSLGSVHPNDLVSPHMEYNYTNTRIDLFTSQVRVPTHLDGRSLYWEFATDGYDIGFGLFFEWVDPEDTQVG